jgi:hypothetical protein
VTEDAVVNTVVDSSSVHYAVIAGLRTETGPERLVIAYSNEASLRDLIAAPSILATGFSSREEAVAGRRVSVLTAPSHRRMPKTMADRQTERYQQELNWEQHPADTRSALGRLARFLVASYGHVAAAAIAIFFSRNAVSAIIRMALGSSV